MEIMLKIYKNTSNTFVRIDYIADLLPILSNSKLKVLCSRTPYSYQAFFTDLHEYNLTQFYKRTKTKNVDAIELSFLLPKGLNAKTFNTLHNTIIQEEINNLPFISYIKERGTAKYLCFLISEREYSSNTITHCMLAPCDTYKKYDSTKNKTLICKKDDDGAFLSEEKGSLRKKWQSHFTNKTRYFNGCVQDLINITNRIKKTFIRVLQSLNSTINRAFFKKINSRKYSNIFVINNIKDLNNLLCDFDHKLDKALNGLYDCKLYDNNYQKLWSIRTKINNQLSNFTFRFSKNSNKTLSIYYKQNRKSFLENLNCYKEIINQNINNFYKEVF